MIVKQYDLKKIINTEINFYLLYGDNLGLIEETKNDLFKKKFSENVYNYDEVTILLNEKHFLEEIYTKSFFEEEKLIFINNVSDKILKLISEIFEKGINKIKLVLITKKLEKKSKLRNFFEKDNQLIIVPFYEDNYQSLFNIAKEYFRFHNIKISSENINVLIENSQGSRLSLKNELEKIRNFTTYKKSINFQEMSKIINLDVNYNFSEIVDSCLAKNKKKTLRALNESIISTDEIYVILRTFLHKLKRLKILKKNLDINANIDSAIMAYKPAIFWKEKDIVKLQIKLWSLNQINLLIKEVNFLEIFIKKNIQQANKLINNFIIKKLN